MTEGTSETGRFSYFWKGDEYYIVDIQTGREFHLGLILNRQVAQEIALNTCRILEGLVGYNPSNAPVRERLIMAMREVLGCLPCPRLCDGCNMQGRDEESVGYLYLACYLKSRIDILVRASGSR